MGAAVHRVVIGVAVRSAMCLVGFGRTAESQSTARPPLPAAALQALTTALSGSWSLSVQWEPDASNPNGVLNAGQETWRAGPGGYTLLEEEHLRMPQGDVFLLGAVWWSSATKNLRGIECQNRLPYTCDVEASRRDYITMSWDGKQFVIDEIEGAKTGKKSLWHEVWSDITPESFTQTGEYGAPGAPRKRLFTIHAKRSTAPISAPAGGSNTAGPAPELQSLATKLMGRWSTKYEFEPGGMSPHGGTGTGEEVWRTGPGGYVLLEEEHIQRPSGEAFLLAFHWWDETTHRLRGLLCNNSGPAACDLSTYANSALEWDGKELTVDLKFPQSGKEMAWHEVWSGISSSSFTQVGDMGAVSGPLKRVVTIHGTKIAH